MIELSHINITFDQHIVFKNAQFIAPDHGMIALTGASGSGKTTLLKAVLNHLISGDGESFSTNLKKEDVVYVDQLATIDQQLSITSFFNLLYEIYHKEIDETRVDHYLTLLKLDQIDRKRIIAHLSSGQRKRLYIACALSLDVKCLMFDEPTSSIDYMMKRKLFEIMKEESKERCIILSTHESEFDDLYDVIYHIHDCRLNVTKGSELLMLAYDVQNPDSEIDYHYGRIARYRGRQTIRSLVLLLVFLTFIFNIISFQQVYLVYDYNSSNRLLNTAVQNHLYFTFGTIDSQLMPYDFPYTYAQDLGGQVDVDAVERIRSLPHVDAVYPYYQLNPFQYDTRYTDVDNTRSHVTVSYDDEVKLDYDMGLNSDDGYNPPSFALCSYYEESKIMHNQKPIKGNWLNQKAADTLHINKDDFNHEIKVSIDVGVPSYLAICDWDVTYYENGEPQDVTHLIEDHEVVYDKQTVTLKVDGILSDSDYENFYAANYESLLYVDGHELDSIVKSHLAKKVRKQRKQYPEYNERIGTYVPTNYVVYVDSIDNFTEVSRAIESVNSRIMVCIPTSDAQGWADTAVKEFNNTLIQHIVFTVIGMIAMLTALFSYHSSHRFKMTFLKNCGLSFKSISRVLKHDLLIISIPFILINTAISYLRMDYGYGTGGVFFYEDKRILLVIFFVLSCIVAVLLNMIDAIIIRRCVHD